MAFISEKIYLFSDKEQSEAKKIYSAFDEDDCWINSGDVLVMNDEYEVFFCDRLGDTFRSKFDKDFGNVGFIIIISKLVC